LKITQKPRETREKTKGNKRKMSINSITKKDIQSIIKPIIDYDNNKPIYFIPEYT
jgi:hypothetical protein